MNILYIEHYAGSPEMGMEFRPYYLSREWVKMGHHVTILAGDFSHLRKKNPDVSSDFQVEVINDIEYLWIRSGHYEGNGVARALSMARFVGKIEANVKMIVSRYHPDIVISSSTYPLDTFPAQRIAKIAGAKYIHEVHDMWPVTLYEVGGMSKLNPFAIIMQLSENSAYKHCDKCIALEPYTKNYMVSHGLRPDKWTNIQNGIVEEEWQNPQELPEEHKLFFDQHSDNFIIGYFGGHGPSNALDQCLNIAKAIQENHMFKKVIFVLVGDGPEKERLKERAKNERITNVFFLNGVSKLTIPNLLKRFDCTYMTGLSSPLYRFGLCLNKMYDSMRAGLPIICAFNAPDTLVKQYECGYQCNPENESDVIAAFARVLGMSKDERLEMGNRGKEAIEKYYTYNKLAEKFINTVISN